MLRARSLQSNATFALALLFILGNSGGIVGRAFLRPSPRAALGLRLAALEVFPQCRAQALLLPRLLRAFCSIVHDDKTLRSKATTLRRLVKESGTF
jgi:hypothetical protein